jgi:tRNA G46 methylase TrmB
MDGNSPEIVSAQSGPHARLDDVVRRHRDHLWRAPLHAPTVSQFARWHGGLDRARPLVVDLGCGHGDSTLGLVAQHRDADLLGVDQSAHRLSRLAPSGYAEHGSATLMRAEAATVLRLLAASGQRIDVLYLLYPNPWPKPEHLLRRWHGHPVFPTLLANARRIVLRTNWRLYADEFAQATRLFGRAAELRRLPVDAEVLTPFERKYRSSGHDRFELTSDDA